MSRRGYFFFRHPGGSRGPGATSELLRPWIPAFAGMTDKKSEAKPINAIAPLMIAALSWRSL